ncbi:hypothetical protein Avbf_18807 [Armadillidium vulgare]|nr:hypothetical protein Avbf_18807 [Armadillidium vulgare]
MNIEEERQNINKKLERMNQLSTSLNNFEHLYERLNYCKTPKFSEFRKDFHVIKYSLQNLHTVHSSFLKPKITPDIVLANFSSNQNFFRQIMVELYRKRSIYAYKSEWDQVEIYWGKLSYKAKQLCIHSFTTERPPSSSIIVAFRDLENCMNLDNFQTFIDIAADHIVCKIFSSSPITWNFVKSCTGEEGTSFKGSNVKIKIFSRDGHKFTDVIIKDEHPNVCGFQNYKFLSSLPWISNESISDKLRVYMNGDFCRIRRYHSLSNTEEVLEEVPIASATSYGHIFSSDGTNEKDSSDSYIETKAIVKDCGLLILPPVKQKNN